MKDQFVGDRIELDNALAFWIYRVYQGLRRELYRGFVRAGHEITPEQWIILVRLWERDGRLQGELCETTVKDGPTISRAIDVLEARNIVERRSSPDDGRLRWVHLTRAGKALRLKLVPAVRELVEQLQTGVSELELIATRRTLKRMAANLDFLERGEIKKPAARKRKVGRKVPNGLRAV